MISSIFRHRAAHTIPQNFRIIHRRLHGSVASAVEAREIDECANGDVQSLSTPKLQDLYDKIIQLQREEVNILGALVIQVLGKKIYPGEFGVGVNSNTLGSASPSQTEPEIGEEEKTSFDVKLTSFDPKAKIKLIKEVRALGGLGLKEAKELVESIPKVLQKGIKKDEAEALKARLEAIGASVELC